MNIRTNYDIDDEARILGDDEYSPEGEKPVFAAGELTEAELDAAVTATTREALKPLLDQLTPEQLRAIEEAGLLIAPDRKAIETIEQMVEENKQGQGLGM